VRSRSLGNVAAASPRRRAPPPPRLPRLSAAASLGRRVPRPPRPSAAASLRRRVTPPPRHPAAASPRRVTPPPRQFAAASHRRRVSSPPGNVATLAQGESKACKANKARRESEDGRLWLRISNRGVTPRNSEPAARERGGLTVAAEERDSTRHPRCPDSRLDRVIFWLFNGNKLFAYCPGRFVKLARFVERHFPKVSPGPRLAFFLFSSFFWPRCLSQQSLIEALHDLIRWRLQVDTTICALQGREDNSAARMVICR
jgi:hypothetical protein